VSQPALKIFPNIAELHKVAADLFLTIASNAVSVNGIFYVSLSGGTTPQGLYHLLALSPFKEQIPWTKTHIFWGDERLVSPNDPGSNYGQLTDILLNQIPIPSENIHRMKGELDPQNAVDDYKDQLRQSALGGAQWPIFDLALMGMGHDGHTASLFPGPISTREKEEPVIAVTADYDSRPANRITLTPLVFNETQHVIFLVTGANKSTALTAILNGPYQPEIWPAQRIQPKQGTTIWLVDEAAAGKTVHG